MHFDIHNNPVQNMVALSNDGAGKGEHAPHALVDDDTSSVLSLGMEDTDGPSAEEAAHRPPSPSASNSESTPPVQLPSQVFVMYRQGPVLLSYLQ